MSCLFRCGLLTGFAALTLFSCSLGTVDAPPCVNHADCRAAFGFGFACNEDGLCANDRPQRCTAVAPADLFENPAAYRDRYPLGVIVSQGRDRNEARTNAVALVADAVSRNGGVLGGRELAVAVCTAQVGEFDDGLDGPEAAVQGAHWLFDVFGAPAIVGPATSAETIAVYESLGERDALLISMAATSEEITGLDGPSTEESPGRVWRTAVPDSFQSRAIVADMRSRGILQIGIVFEADAYGSGIADTVETLFDGPGESVTRLPYVGDSAIARQNAARDPSLEEILFVGTGAEARAFLLFASENPALDDRTFFLTDAAATPELLTDNVPSDSVLSRTRGTRPASPAGIVYFNFLGTYSSRFSSDADAFTFVANAFDAGYALIYAAGWANGSGLNPMSGRDLGRGLRQLSSGPSVPLDDTGWSVGMAAVAAGQSVDLDGASGCIDFDPETRQVTGDIDIWRIDLGPPPEIVSGGRYTADELAAL